MGDDGGSVTCNQNSVASAGAMPKRKPIAKRQRPRVVKPRHAAVLQGAAAAADGASVTGAGVSVGERELKLARALTDTEARVRDASLDALREWLQTHGSGLSDSDVDRLWKALFYCVWMADGAGPTARVIGDIGGLHGALDWGAFRGTLRCLAREWGGIDAHRVDKFYSLANAALAEAVAVVLAADDAVALKEEAGIITACIVDILVPAARRGAKGVLMHFLDVWVDKVLVPVLTKASGISSNAAHAIWDSLLAPLYPLLKTSGGSMAAVRVRLEERVLRRLATEEVLVALEKVDPRAKHDMLVRTSKAVFAAAADKGTEDGERKRLYELRTAIKAVNIGLEAEYEKPKAGGGKVDGTVVDVAVVKAN